MAMLKTNTKQNSQYKNRGCLIKIVRIQFQTDKLRFLYTECKNVSHVSFQTVANFWDELPQEVLKADSISRFGKGLKKFMSSESINRYR